MGAIAFGVFVVYGPELMTAAERIQKGQYPFELHRKQPTEGGRSIFTDPKYGGVPNFLIPPFMRSNAGFLYDLAIEEQKYEPWALR